MALLPQVVLSSASQQLFGEQGETAAHPEISVHWRAKEILLVCINILAWLPELYFTLTVFYLNAVKYSHPEAENAV